MTADESRAVIALWQQERVEQTGLTDRPAVPDVAEGLDIPVEEVQRLLAEVRARRLEEERALARERKLAKAERRLAEEKASLADVQQQRAEMRQGKAGRKGRIHSRRDSGGIEPGLWSDAKHISPEYYELESQRVGRTLMKLCIWLVLVCTLAAAICLSLPHHSGLAPCYINNKEADPADCAALEHGNYSPMIKYLH